MVTLIAILTFLHGQGVTLDDFTIETHQESSQVYDCDGYVDSGKTILVCAAERKLVIVSGAGRFSGANLKSN